MNYFGTSEERDELDSRLPAAAGLERLQVLVCLAWYCREADTRRAIALVEEAEALLAQVSELAPAERARCEARLLLTRAAAEWLFGRLSAASALTLQARDRFDALDDANGASDACMVEVHICESMDYPEAANDARRAAQAYGEKGKDPLREALCRGTLAWTAVYQRKADAQAQVNRFLDDVRALRHPLLDAEEAAIHGAAHDARSDYAGSVIHYERSCELYLANGQRWYAVGSANQVSHGYRFLGDNVQALEWAERGLDLVRSAGWPMSVAGCLRIVASGMRSLRRFTAARELLHEALALLRPRGRSNLLWFNYLQLSDLACDLGEFEEALGWASEAERLGHSNAVALPPGPYVLLGQLVQARALSGLNRPTEAFAQAQQALAGSISRSDDSFRIRTLIELAHISRAHGLALPEGSKAANAEIHYLEAALAVGQGIEGYKVPAELWSDLSRSHEAAGDLSQALACERRASAARDSDASKKASDMATLLQVRYESERSKAQAAAARVEAEYQRSLAVAEAAANRAKSTFLANMSHELRTPLNAVLGYAQLLQHDKNLDERQRAGLTTIRRSGEHLLTIINDVLDLAQVEAGKFELHPQAMHLPYFLRVVADIINVKAQEKALVLEFALAPDLPEGVHADEKRLRQVLLNLLSNAVKFTAQGRVGLSVRELERFGEQARLRFEVSDSGQGIAAQQLELIFQPFEQAAGDRQRGGGTGLGLAISRQLVRLMGGDIHVQSEPGAGSRFWFDIDVPVADAGTGRAAGPSRVLAYEGRRRRVLVVDDIAANRATAVAMLELVGLDTVEAADGEAALAMVQACAPDLIIIDVAMPVLGGREAIERLRRMPGFDSLPVIVVSASVSGADQLQGLASGANVFLPKPIELDALLQQVGRLLSLSWVSEAEAHTHDSQAQAPMVAPPQEELATLHRLAREGNMGRIRAWADHLETLGAQHRPFAQQLRALADKFQSRAIVELANRYRHEQVPQPD